MTTLFGNISIHASEFYFYVILFFFSNNSITKIDFFTIIVNNKGIKRDFANYRIQLYNY